MNQCLLIWVLSILMGVNFLECSSSIFVAPTQCPPKVLYVASRRLMCAKNGDFEQYKGAAMSFYWFIWEKGYKGDTILKWFN